MNAECLKLMPNDIGYGREFHLHMHEDCARKLIGEDRMKERAEQIEKHKQAREERRKQLFENWAALCNAHHPNLPCQTLEQFLRHAPTIEAVEVVRCNDCRHLMSDRDGEDFLVFGCGRLFTLYDEWVDVCLDDFCSHGERKDGEQNATD